MDVNTNQTNSSTSIREADRDILATMIHWLMSGEKTQLLTWENTYQGSFKIHNKEELASQLGLRWDTLQRKMKKLGIWCVPERGCPVNDRVYYFPTDPSVYKGTGGSPMNMNNNNGTNIINPKQQSIPSQQLQQQFHNIPQESQMFSTGPFLPSTSYNQQEYISPSNPIPYQLQNSSILGAVASSTNMTYVHNIQQNGTPIKLPPIHQVMPPPISMTNFGIPLVPLMSSSTPQYYHPSIPSTVTSFSPPPVMRKSYIPEVIDTSTNYSEPPSEKQDQEFTNPSKRSKQIKDEDN